MHCAKVLRTVYQDWSFGLLLGAGPVALFSGLGHLDLSCGLVLSRGLWTNPDGWPCRAVHVDCPVHWSYGLVLWTGPVDWSYGLVLWTGSVFWSFGLVQGTCETGPAGWSFGVACELILLAGPSDLVYELDLRTGSAWVGLAAGPVHKVTKHLFFTF
jgi:hypothetical protein